MVHGIAEIITVESDLVNVDFADVSKVMRDSGRAHMAVATAEGDNRAEAVAEASLRSPLLDHNLISGAKNILLNISVSNAEELMYEEVVRILEYIQMHASVQDEHGTIHNANIIWGTSEKPQLGNAIELVVVATGFEGEEGEDGQPAVLKKFPTRTFQMTMRGRYATLIEFLYQLGDLRLERLVTINKIALTPDGSDKKSGGKSPVLTIQIPITAYMREGG